MAIGKWDEKIAVEYVAILYMGIPVSLNVEQTLTGGELYPRKLSNSMFSYY